MDRIRFLKGCLELAEQAKINLFNLLKAEVEKGDSPRIEILAKEYLEICDNIYYCKSEIKKCE